VKDTYRGELFRDVVAALEQAGHKMCVLRNYQSYPEGIGHDVDVISENPGQIPHILSEQKVAAVVQAYRYEAKHIYTLCRWHRNEPVFIQLDVSADFRYFGRLFYGGEEFFGASRPYKFFKVPSAELEFGAYLIKHLAKRTLNEAKFRRLTELYEENPVGCDRQLARFFPEAETTFIADSVRRGDWKPVLGAIDRLQRELLDKAGREQPLSLLLHRVDARWRQLERLVRPPGFMVSFLGVDGAGKSTVIARVSLGLVPAFQDIKQFHKRTFPSAIEWTKRYLLRARPDELEEEGVSAHRDGSVLSYDPLAQPPSRLRDPHALPPRRLIVSLAGLGFKWANYTLSGYVADIYPRLIRSTLVLLDRDYHDLLVDPKRYRYGGPAWFPRAVGWFIPRPQLVILLDAPPEVLQSRRRELPVEETTRQREAYLELTRNLPNGHVVDASKPLDEVVVGVEQIILDYMAERIARRSKCSLKSILRGNPALGS
jgi:thymidylate kinase